MPYLRLAAGFLSVAAVLGTGCAKNQVEVDTTSCTHAATIVGFTPCSSTGYIIALASPRDTVVTYNLPAALAALVKPSTSPHRPYLLAPGDIVRITIGYSPVVVANQTQAVCVGTINVAPFNQLTNNGREIRILCAEKVL